MNADHLRMQHTISEQDHRDALWNAEVIRLTGQVSEMEWSASEYANRELMLERICGDQQAELVRLSHKVVDLELTTTELQRIAQSYREYAMAGNQEDLSPASDSLGSCSSAGSSGYVIPHAKVRMQDGSRMQDASATESAPPPPPPLTKSTQDPAPPPPPLTKSTQDPTGLSDSAAKHLGFARLYEQNAKASDFARVNFAENDLVVA